MRVMRTMMLASSQAADSPLEHSLMADRVLRWRVGAWNMRERGGADTGWSPTGGAAYKRYRADAERRGEGL